jgi:hypothetical protein
MPKTAFRLFRTPTIIRAAVTSVPAPPSLVDALRATSTPDQDRAKLVAALKRKR